MSLTGRYIGLIKMSSHCKWSLLGFQAKGGAECAIKLKEFEANPQQFNVRDKLTTTMPGEALAFSFQK